MAEKGNPWLAYNGRDSAAKLNKIPCYIKVASANYGSNTNTNTSSSVIQQGFWLTSLPELTWRKEASYNTQNIIGRSSPIISYSSSKSRTIEIVLHMHNPTYQDMIYNMNAVHYLASAVHPRYQSTYAPPPICTLACGSSQGGAPLTTTTASGSTRSANTSPFAYLRFIMTSISQSFNSESVWDDVLMVPRNWDVQISGEVIYNYVNLPGSSDVLSGKW